MVALVAPNARLILHGETSCYVRLLAAADSWNPLVVVVDDDVGAGMPWRLSGKRRRRRPRPKGRLPRKSVTRCNTHSLLRIKTVWLLALNCYSHPIYCYYHCAVLCYPVLSCAVLGLFSALHSSCCTILAFLVIYCALCNLHCRTPRGKRSSEAVLLWVTRTMTISRTPYCCDPSGTAIYRSSRSV